MKKFLFYFSRYWIFLVILAICVVSFSLPFVFLRLVESYTRNYILASTALYLPLGLIQSVIFVVLMYWLHYGGGFGKLKKSRIEAGNVNVTFKDVVGLEEAKKEAMEVVALLRDRTRVKQIGGKIIKGILMIGPPGCGKTLLAKGIATEAGIPFLSIAGSEFVEIFVGVGASRVRKLFKTARQYAHAYGACIVFIDELEVIGRGRTFSFLGAGEETNSTQNQLLVEMDGLTGKNEHVVVIGATNANVDVLDKALLRPGRFDRKIFIAKPNLAEREEILKYYLSKVKFDETVDVGRLARKSVYKSPADLENIVKEAALIAARAKRDKISQKDISGAIDRIDLGIAHRLNMTQHERELVAFHEAGHLVVLYFLHPTDDVFKASILSRGEALGMVHQQPREERFTRSRKDLVADVQVSLAGYMSEKIKFGVTSSGVASDFQHAMKAAHDMVWRYGMGSGGQLGDFSFMPEAHMSEQLKQSLNQQTQDLIQHCAREVETFLRRESMIVERFAKELLGREELEYDEIEAIFKEYGKARGPDGQLPDSKPVVPTPQGKSIL